MTEKKALIMVDLQNDFCEGGSLAVKEGDAVVPLANQLQPYFEVIVATQDWHPQNHSGFASNHSGYAVGQKIGEQILWPDHCVQNSVGAELHPHLDTQKITKIIHKGINKNIDSYSAFFDNAHLRATGLGDYLQEQGIKEVYLLGLATDYCVKFSALDARQLGFSVFVIEDACRGIELNPGDIQAAFNEMQEAGVKLINSKEILRAN